MSVKKTEAEKLCKGTPDGEWKDIKKINMKEIRKECNGEKQD